MARCLLPIPLSLRHSCVCLYEDLSNSPSTHPPSLPPASALLRPTTMPSPPSCFVCSTPPLPLVLARIPRTSCNDRIRAFLPRRTIELPSLNFPRFSTNTLLQSAIHASQVAKLKEILVGLILRKFLFDIADEITWDSRKNIEDFFFKRDKAKEAPLFEEPTE